MINFSLKNKVALVTGGSRGIGEAIAKTLAEYDAHVIIVSRKIDGLRKVADEINQSGKKATPIACHAGHEEQIEALCRQIENDFGKLDILVNNAATNPHFDNLLTADARAWDKIFEVNLKGPFFMTQKAVPLMKKAGGGAIVNVSSVNGLRPGLLQGLYSMTKAALISMTRTLAGELAGDNIRVNALAPGFTETKFSQAIITNQQLNQMVLQKTPMGRMAQPEEMTGTVLYLVSEAASFTTGACIVCDGGFLLS